MLNRPYRVPGKLLTLLFSFLTHHSPCPPAMGYPVQASNQPCPLLAQGFVTHSPPHLLMKLLPWHTNKTKHSSFRSQLKWSPAKRLNPLAAATQPSPNPEIHQSCNYSSIKCQPFLTKLHEDSNGADAGPWASTLGGGDWLFKKNNTKVPYCAHFTKNLQSIVWTLSSGLSRDLKRGWASGDTKLNLL